MTCVQCTRYQWVSLKLSLQTYMSTISLYYYGLLILLEFNDNCALRLAGALVRLAVRLWLIQPVMQCNPHLLPAVFYGISRQMPPGIPNRHAE